MGKDFLEVLFNAEKCSVSVRSWDQITMCTSKVLHIIGMNGILLTIIYLSVFTSLARGSEKKGVCHWAPSFMCDDFKVLNNMTWWYDFRMSLQYFHHNNICSSTIDNYKSTYVPMVWGYWKSTKIQISDEARFVLGFNEPNHKAQSYMTPQRAADAWPELEKNSKGKPLVSPSAAACGKGCLSDEITWFDEFFELCKGCRVDFLAVHTYWCNARMVMSYLRRLHEKYGKNIWLTEFACAGNATADTQLRFMKDILPQLERADFVYRYSWFSARIKGAGFITTSASLLEPDSSKLTPLGQFYNSFQGPDKPRPTKPSEEDEESDDSDEEQDVETLLILQSFTSNPTPWWEVLNFMQANIYQLPQPERDVYEELSRKQMKKRIKQMFLETMCTDPEDIQDVEIRGMVEDIRELPEEGEKKKNSGNLRVPPC